VVGAVEGFVVEGLLEDLVFDAAEEAGWEMDANGTLAMVDNAVAPAPKRDSIGAVVSIAKELRIASGNLDASMLTTFLSVSTVPITKKSPPEIGVCLFKTRYGLGR
jgi:hypothetical protein